MPFSRIKVFFTAFVWSSLSLVKLQTEGQTISCHTKLQNSNQNIVTYPGLAYSDFGQPGPGAPLLGLAKSICSQSS